MIRLPCSIPGCRQLFKNKSGRTKHMRTAHPEPLRGHRTFHQAAPAPLSPSPEHYDDAPLLPDSDGEPEHVREGFMPEDGTCVQLGPIFRAFHPCLTGNIYSTTPKNSNVTC